MNLDAVEKALKGEVVELWTSPSERMTYEPTAKGAAVKKNGKIVAVFDRRGFVRYWKAHGVASTSREKIEKLTIAIERETGLFKASLGDNSYEIRAELRKEHYRPLAKLLENDLVAAYVVSDSPVFFSLRPPAAIEIAEYCLEKLAAIASVTNYCRFTYGDAVVISRLKGGELSGMLERIIKLPFPSRVPIVRETKRYRFYSAKGLYCFLKNGRVEANACTDWKDFAEAVKAKYREVMA